MNMNDYMNIVYIYNADTFKKADAFTVTGTKNDSTTEDVGEAVYDDKTKRIVFTPTKPLCMSLYTQLNFAPKA